MTIEERLDRLEHQNRNLRRALGGLLLLVLVVPLAAFVWQDKKPKVAKFDTIEANTVRTKWVYATDLKMVNGMTNIHISASRDQALAIFQHFDKSVTLEASSDAGIADRARGIKEKRIHVDSPSVTVRNDTTSDHVELVTTKKHGPQVLLWTSGRLSAELAGTKTGSGARQCYLRFYDMKASGLAKAKVLHQVPK